MNFISNTVDQLQIKTEAKGMSYLWNKIQMTELWIKSQIQNKWLRHYINMSKPIFKDIFFEAIPFS